MKRLIMFIAVLAMSNLLAGTITNRVGDRLTFTIDKGDDSLFKDDRFIIKYNEEEPITLNRVGENSLYDHIDLDRKEIFNVAVFLASSICFGTMDEDMDFYDRLGSVLGRVIFCVPPVGLVGAAIDIPTVPFQITRIIHNVKVRRLDKAIEESDRVLKVSKRRFNKIKNIFFPVD